MEFSADFFSLRFLGVGPWARHPWGDRRVLTDAPRTPTAPTQGRKGHGLEAWRWGRHPAKETRLLTRHLQEVWFLGHACHALATSLFTSLFAGKREVPSRRGRREAPASASAAGPFFFSLPQAKIPADLATQGQRFHLATTRGGFGLHPSPPRPPPLLFVHDLGPKTSKKGRMGPEDFRVGCHFVSRGTLISKPGPP